MNHKYLSHKEKASGLQIGIEIPTVTELNAACAVNDAPDFPKCNSDPVNSVRVVTGLTAPAQSICFAPIRLWSRLQKYFVTAASKYRDLHLFMFAVAQPQIYNGFTQIFYPLKGTCELVRD